MATPFYRRIANRKKRRPKPPRPSLTTKQILAWADDHRATTGQWPHADAGLVRSTLAERLPWALFTAMRLTVGKLIDSRLAGGDG